MSLIHELMGKLLIHVYIWVISTLQGHMHVSNVHDLMVVFFVTVAAKAQTVSGQICACRVSPCMRTQHRVTMMTQVAAKVGAWWVPNTESQ